MNHLLKRTFEIIVLMFAAAVSLAAQPRGDRQSLSSGLIQIEKNILPSDSGFVCYISYRIPYRSLIFIKNGNGFHAGLTLSFDFKSEGKVVCRKSTSNSVTIASYDSTNSADDYLQGFIEFKCDSKELIAYPYLSINNSDRNFDLDSIKIDVTKLSKQRVLPPVIVKQNGTSCDHAAPFELVNFNNTIPFSMEDFQIIIPVTDSTLGKIDVTINQDKREIYKKTLTEFVHDDLLMKECAPNVVINQTKIGKNGYFVVDGFSHKLNEANTKLIVSENGKKISEFELNVVWENKPRILMNPELAIQTLSSIESDDKVDTLLSGDSKDYYNVLTEYWNAKRVDKSTSFNPLESEFYKRADYALTHFSSINNKNGVKTDRGKVYIQFGKPDEVKREYSESNYVIEIWIYKRVNREFVFSDKTGLGNYTLEK